MRSRLTVSAILASFLLLGVGTALAFSLSDEGSATSTSEFAASAGVVEIFDLNGEHLFGDYHVSHDPVTGCMWLLHIDNATAEWSVIEYDPISGSVTSHALPFRTSLYIADSSSHPGAFISHDGSGKLWLAAYDVFGHFDTEKKDFVQVPLPDVDPWPSLDQLPQDEITVQLWRHQPVVSMVLGSDESVWIARDFSRQLIQYDPVNQHFDVVEAPDDIEVPGHSTGYGWWAKSPDEEAEHAASLTVESESPLDSLMPWEILAAGADGDVWYVKDGLDLARYDLRSQEEVVYALPRESLLLRRGPSSSDDNLVRPRYTSPAFTSVVVDEDGNLWFSYIMGHTRIGVAYR